MSHERYISQESEKGKGKLWGILKKMALVSAAVVGAILGLAVGEKVIKR